MKWWAIITGTIGLTISAVVLIMSGASAADFVGPAIAFFAAVIAGMSMLQSKRSADSSASSAAIAKLQEERLRSRWSIEPHSLGSRHTLRNLGSQAAFDVRLGGPHRVFFDGAKERVEVGIASGEARSFIALGSFGGGGSELEISWLPEGETERRTWIEVLEPSPSETASRGLDDEARTMRRHREEDQHREDVRDWKATMIDLANAWSTYQSDPASKASKLKVQILIASLPPSLAREMGHAVDVARDVWGPGEFPLENHVADVDRPLLADVLPEIELLWNMRTVSGYVVYGPIAAEGPNTEPRVWWAMRGYVERVRERESGDRKLRASPRDQEDQREAERRFAQMQRGLDQPSEDNDGADYA